MLVFHKIRYKNFLSSGNQFTEIDFEKNHTNLIIGTNGAGKSTVLDALTFVLFNKPFRKINKPQLVNTTNEKDCLVEIEFTVNSRDYLVRRGIKPNIFDIEVNGNPLHKEADDRANQRILEENILKVNYKSFTQIVILGSSTFVPFMQLATAHRREVIEDLLDIRIFSAMNALIKDKIREKKDQVKSLDLKKETLKDKMKMQQEFIEELENRGNANISNASHRLVMMATHTAQLTTYNKHTLITILRIVGKCCGVWSWFISTFHDFVKVHLGQSTCCAMTIRIIFAINQQTIEHQFKCFCSFVYQMFFVCFV